MSLEICGGSGKCCHPSGPSYPTFAGPKILVHLGTQVPRYAPKFNGTWGSCELQARLPNHCACSTRRFECGHLAIRAIRSSLPFLTPFIT